MSNFRCPHCGREVREWEERLVLCGEYYHLRIKRPKNHKDLYWIGKRTHHLKPLPNKVRKQSYHDHSRMVVVYKCE
jgi:hypothetical protein